MIAILHLQLIHKLSQNNIIKIKVTVSRSNPFIKMVFRTLAVLSVLLCVQICVSQNRKNVLDVYRKEVFDYAVLRNQRPVVVYFTKSSCSPCRIVLSRLEDFARKNSKIMDVAVVDVEKRPELKEHFDVKVIPTTRAYYKGDLEGEIKGPSWNAIEKLANNLINQ